MPSPLPLVLTVEEAARVLRISRGAVDDANASYVFSTRDYGQVRWHAAALIFSDESNLLGGLEDSTLQVAIERAREAHRANGAPRTLAALDFALEATKAAAHSSTQEAL